MLIFILAVVRVSTLLLLLLGIYVFNSSTGKGEGGVGQIMTKTK